MNNTTPQLIIEPLKTRIFLENENLLDFILTEVPRERICEGSILAITSKIVSLSEGRLIDKDSTSKGELIDQEADYNFGMVGYGCYLTVKHGLFIPSAGIDESNSQSEKYILYPEDPFQSAKLICSALKEKWGLKKLGIILTDSHTTPLRRGVMGIALAHWGFQGIKNLIGTPDLFDRKLQMTTVNIADGLAVAATLMMGESNECRPLCILRSPDVIFTDETNPNEIKMPLQDDLYFPFFKASLENKI